MALTGPRKVFFNKRAQAPSSTQLRASKPTIKADTTSFITPYAFGAGDIRPQVQNVVFGNNGSDFFHSPEMFAPIVRASSSGSLALWSRLSGYPESILAPDTGSEEVSLASTARESPTFAQKILFPTINTVTHVDPLKYTSMPDSL